jgi:hypothetical protein
MNAVDSTIMKAKAFLKAYGRSPKEKTTDEVLVEAKKFLKTNKNLQKNEPHYWINFATGVVNKCHEGTFYDFDAKTFRPLKK